MKRYFRVGDPVVFVVSKSSIAPGPRAKHVYPATAGETYSYQIDKFWAVSGVRADGHLVLVTRRGKHHEVRATDPRLRPAHLWEKWFYRARFPQVTRIDNRAYSIELATTRISAGRQSEVEVQSSPERLNHAFADEREPTKEPVGP